MVRLGLCCIFRERPIKFFTTTAAAVSRMSRADGLEKIARLCGANAAALLAALGYCAANGIGCFRVGSQILPIKMHPTRGYQIDALPGADEIVGKFQACGAFAKAHGLRLCFHPDQFVVLNSGRPEVVAASIQEIEYQAEVAQWIGADVINIHAGGAYGDKPAALSAFARGVDRLSANARERLTVENDDLLFAPADLLPICRAAGLPLVYDIHHHRCHPDGLSELEATQGAISTWNREPLFHISSPIQGWGGPHPRRHHDYIDLCDFPTFWQDLSITVEVEAKAKELAVARLRQGLRRRQSRDRQNQRP